MDVLEPVHPQTMEPIALKNLLDIATGEVYIEVPPLSHDRFS